MKMFAYISVGAHETHEKHVVLTHLCSPSFEKTIHNIWNVLLLMMDYRKRCVGVIARRIESGDLRAAFHRGWDNEKGHMSSRDLALHRGSCIKDNIFKITFSNPQQS
jgi:hypothetical protein